MGYYDKEGERKVPYKEDSTDGASLIQPLTYKGDTLTQAWVDSRVLATLSNWLESIEYYPRSLSDVARAPLEILVDHLVSSGKVKMIDNTVEARTLLQKRFRVKLNRGGRGGKNALHNSVLTGMKEESKGVTAAVSEKDRLIEEALKKYNELYGGKENDEIVK